MTGVMSYTYNSIIWDETGGSQVESQLRQML